MSIQRADYKLVGGRIKAYYRLTKPGIIYGNILNATAGFLLASALSEWFDVWLLAATLMSIALIIASACVFNNYTDQGIDKKMARTKKRALVTGQISNRSALVYASILGTLGFGMLGVFTNRLTFALGIVAIVMYVVVYGVAKRKSVFGTIVGSISGSLPPVAGYTAVSGAIDGGAVLVFLILTFWQMPHFYAIAMYRKDDYAAADIPVWPVKKGMRSTKIQIVLFVVLFMLATTALTVWGYTGYTFAAVMAIVGLKWLWLGLQGFRTTDDTRWARSMFFFSLIVILVLAVMMSVGALLP